jgi:hypothetical protein
MMSIAQHFPERPICTAKPSFDLGQLRVSDPRQQLAESSSESEYVGNRLVSAVHEPMKIDR